MSKRAVFLDRDGTIIEDTGFIRSVEDVRLLPRAGKAVRRLNDAGWLVIVVSNQSGVARGLLTEKDVAATNKRMTQLLKAEGAKLDGIYFCPHLPEGKVPNYSVVCDCRKPRPGLLLRAAEEHDVDLAASLMIGDAPRDVEAGIAAGTGAMLLTESPARARQVSDACRQAPDLLAAVTDFLKDPSGFTPAKPEKKPAKERKAAADREGKNPKAGRKRRASKRKTAAAKPEKETTVTEEEKHIPVRRAPKEFTPEPEMVGEEKEAAAAGVEGDAEVEPRILHCGRCGRAFPAALVEEGKAYDAEGITLCGDCMVELEAQSVATDEVTNDDLLRELRNITRALTYERFSYWHVLGAIGQALAIGTLVGAYYSGASPEGLLYAVFFQLLALTFFVIGRR